MFVERAVLCIPLARILEFRLGQKCNPIMGVQSMTTEDRNRNLEEFRQGTCRILVTTSSLEEGLDVQDCKVLTTLKLVLRL